MALRYAPKLGTIVAVDYGTSFAPPEMVKRRLAVVVSPPFKARGNIVTVVPLSTTAPLSVMPYHCEIRVPFVLPAYWGDVPRWVKGDMVNAVGFHRVDLLHIGKDAAGKRLYQTEVLPPALIAKIQGCVLRALGL